MAESRDLGDVRDAPDHEAPDESDINDVSTSEWIDCPECGKSIHEDTDRCPYCGEGVTNAAGRKGWVLIGVLFIIAATLATWMW